MNEFQQYQTQLAGLNALVQRNPVQTEYRHQWQSDIALYGIGFVRLFQNPQLWIEAENQGLLKRRSGNNPFLPFLKEELPKQVLPDSEEPEPQNEPLAHLGLLCFSSMKLQDIARVFDRQIQDEEKLIQDKLISLIHAYPENTSQAYLLKRLRDIPVEQITFMKKKETILKKPKKVREPQKKKERKRKSLTYVDHFLSIHNFEDAVNFFQDITPSQFNRLRRMGLLVPLVDILPPRITGSIKKHAADYAVLLQHNGIAVGHINNYWFLRASDLSQAQQIYLDDLRKRGELIDQSIRSKYH